MTPEGIMLETTEYEDVVGTKGEANSIGSRYAGRAESTEGGSSDERPASA